MAMFPEERELTESQIQALCARIAREEEASNVSFLRKTSGYYVFEGTVSNKPVIFNFDTQSGFIITEEE